ncbi:MAG: FAD-dependent oxidoreductase, partial [Verrucomicrobia bacterium]|nr:FAD-dependent oxidoreductase [Verrucomicrobiota bacterium]
MSVIKHDVVIIGAGLAGSLAAAQLAGKYDVAVLAKCYPAQSHSCAAQGGIAAALGNLEEDNEHWHWFDTVKGGDYLVDQDAAKILAYEAPEMIYEMEHMGCPFSRTAEGKIAQRKFGGHTRNYGEKPVLRACFSADRTGHALLHTAFEQLVKHGVHVYPEWYCVDLLVEDGVCRGLVAWNMRDSELHVFHTKAVMFATGGGGQAFLITSNAFANTGDGLVVAYNAGVPLQDMEFFQFHPTGIWKRGILLTEGCRGEGGTLVNDKGERFMEKYSPKLMELAPRDLVTRSITTEILEGRGIGGRDYVYLDMRHLGAKKIMERLPDVHSFIMTYLGIDCIDKPVPIQPTAHYMMGGIPCDVHGQVKTGGAKDKDVAGFFAAGECSCVSVHGANRLGTNSLLDIVVFGKRAGVHAGEYAAGAGHPELPEDPAGAVARMLEDLAGHPEGERA